MANSAKKPVNVQIGANIRMARKARGMSQAKLAEIIGVETQSMSSIETGTTGTTLERLHSICLALDMSMDILLFGTKYACKTSALLQDVIALVPESHADLVTDIIMRYMQGIERASQK